MYLVVDSCIDYYMIKTLSLALRRVPEANFFLAGNTANITTG